MRIAALTIGAMCAFAANSIFCRLALGDAVIDAAGFTTIRLVSGAAVLGLLSAFRKQSPLGGGNASWVSAGMLFLYAICFSYAYLSLSAGTGALILFAAVQITMISTAIFQGERLRPSQWSGVGLALAGLIYLVLPGLAGMWLDSQLETRFLTLLGFALGVPLGMWHLIAMTKSKRNETE